ncbi:beta-ketoacyl-ACP reductase [Solwaraspora sp. WMMD937]|uniref:beta-ketoacyl-ACP reductase n=1 Tax=Solwaraspora sp. WMMD937 TaxID=3016090 RepID=UPI00249C2FB7|nr:beta-ketoacyl-ACP reductase [Solwaraspora sp. WMMD937]WFE21568.1 beta-ketoacyl-ACP reductase [Solwaraspora sp. WMMD937]
MDRFADRVALVTGAAQGIGAATARRLAAEGATVAVVDLTAERAGPVVDEIVAAGGSAVAVGCDVTDPVAVDAMVDQTVDAHGRLDILVNNAGITRDNLLFRMPADDWDAVLRTNLSSMFHCCRAAQRHMVPARYGKIVNLSSRSALGNRGQVNYAAAKAGVQGLTATLAIELGPYGINVNAVAPGFVATSMTAAVAARIGVDPDEHRRQVAEQTPLRRVGQPAEIASVIAFLASEDASYVSGQTLYVNGGAR